MIYVDHDVNVGDTLFDWLAIGFSVGDYPSGAGEVADERADALFLDP